MLPPREFLRQESENVGELLRDVLRYDYIPIGTQPFYDECRDRITILNELAADIDAITDKDERHEAIRNLAISLSTLSEQIALIERSHLGEFSWAFGSELTALAQVLSEQKNLTPLTRFKSKDSLFLITTDGGLTSYAVRREEEDDLNYHRRIFTIVIPRSLKHYVLLHTVLGHEIGHAVVIMPHLVDILTPKILTPIESQCKYLKDKVELGKWLETEGGLTGPFDDETLSDLIASWKEEIFCDLFGLALIGPAFFGSLRSLFGALDPSHEHFDRYHPPHIWRFEILKRAYQHLKWDQPITGMPDGDTKTAIDVLNKNLLDFNEDNKFAVDDLYPKNVIETVTDEIVTMIRNAGGSIYAPPSAEALDHLVCALRQLRPPVGQDLKSDDLKFFSIDFRHILHAGWIAFNDKAQTEFKGDDGQRFSALNRLCDQALIQRRGVQVHLKWKEEQQNGRP